MTTESPQGPEQESTPADPADRCRLENIPENGYAKLAHHTLRHIRRFIILVVGSTVLLIGIIMFITPGPAVIVIPLGLGILALEFAWARRLLKKAKARITDSLGSVGNQPERNSPVDD